MNRAELQQLAEDRIVDAQSLIAAGRWAGAYYLAGYAVECALKACIAKFIKAEEFPDKALAQRCFTHNLEQLVVLSGLKDVGDLDAKANANLFTNWEVVLDWTELSRCADKTEPEAKALYHAISEANQGVLPWIKFHW